MGEPSLGSGPLGGAGCLEELPDSLSCIPGVRRTQVGAGQGRPMKQQVGAGRREPRPDYNRNRKYTRQRFWEAPVRGEPVG
jgi:hypothetical protein